MTDVKFPNPSADSLRKAFEKGEFFYISGPGKTSKHKLGGAVKKDSNGVPIEWNADRDIVFIPATNMRVAGRRADIIAYIRQYGQRSATTFSDADVSAALSQAITADNFLINAEAFASEAARVKAASDESKRRKAAGETKSTTKPRPSDETIQAVLNASGKIKTKGNPYIVPNTVAKVPKAGGDGLDALRVLWDKIQDAIAFNTNALAINPDPKTIKLRAYKVGNMNTVAPTYKNGKKVGKSIGAGAQKEDGFNPNSAKVLKMVPGVPVLVNSNDVDAINKYKTALILLNSVAPAGATRFPVDQLVEAMLQQMGRGSEVIRQMTGK
jgi:hypothetical protein